jgi:hypothetical protein
MRRRDFIKVVAGSAMTLPLAARAQQAAMPVVGFLSSGSSESIAHLIPVFRQGLAETGYIEGATSQSNIVGPKVNTIGCRLWWRSCYAARLP